MNDMHSLLAKTKQLTENGRHEPCPEFVASGPTCQPFGLESAAIYALVLLAFGLSIPIDSTVLRLVFWFLHLRGLSHTCVFTGGLDGGRDQ